MGPISDETRVVNRGDRLYQLSNEPRLASRSLYLRSSRSLSLFMESFTTQNGQCRSNILWVQHTALLLLGTASLALIYSGVPPWIGKSKILVTWKWTVLWSEGLQLWLSLDFHNSVVSVSRLLYLCWFLLWLLFLVTQPESGKSVLFWTWWGDQICQRKKFHHEPRNQLDHHAKVLVR